MTVEQLTEQVIKNTESVKSAHHRLNEIGQIAESVHELAVSVTTIAAEFKGLAVKLDDSVGRIEAGQKAQGERIGKVEQAVTLIARNEEDIEAHGKRLDAIEKEPGAAWKNLKGLIISAVVTLVAGFLFGKIF